MLFTLQRAGDDTDNNNEKGKKEKNKNNSYKNVNRPTAEGPTNREIHEEVRKMSVWWAVTSNLIIKKWGGGGEIKRQNI